MKRFTRVFATVLAVLMALSSLCILAFAEGEDAEATEAATEAEKPKLAQDNVIDNWDPAVFESLFKSGGNQTNASLCEEGLKLEWTGNEDTAPDPYFTFSINGYYKRTSSTMPKADTANYVVIKFKGEGLDGMFQLFTQQPDQNDSETLEYMPEDMNEDGWYYLIFDMSFTTLVEGRGNKLTSMRMDWSCGGTQVGAYCIIGAIGFFAEEKDACEFAHIEYVTQGPRATKAPATEPPTEAPTEAPEAPTEAEKSGCGSVVISGAVLVMMAAAAVVALNKKH